MSCIRRTYRTGISSRLIIMSISMPEFFAMILKKENNIFKKFYTVHMESIQLS